ncbi:8564_t:CDS:2 [Cetraspora pellucida]|uniref:8564_t:CDS:1 n=1 Tax=Cetraspora pellucida TaxID=1433469 RepID=A0ACA9JVH8_9GLOM|nr:8564_t:CDS:2 [Cetraspora pellucida]
MSEQKIILNNIDLNQTYTFKEFELINEKLKTHTLEINENPVDLFDLDAKGNLIAMPQATHCMEVTVAEITRKLCSWNLFSRKNGDIKTSQGGFNFNVGGQRTIRAPDVSFTPKAISRQLTQLQRWTFEGQPFTPTLVVEVSDTEKRSKFEDMNFKIISDYFAPGTAVTLGWLIDPKQKRIWVYKRDQCGNVIRNEHCWENIDGGDTLPGFVLDVQMIDYAISQAPTPEASEDEYELKINCPECSESFTECYKFVRHYEKYHGRKKK